MMDLTPVFLALLGVALTTATRIDGVCSPVPAAKGMARPTVPELFRVRVECSLHEQNRTVYVEEYYDYLNNVGRITQSDLMTYGDAFFDYNANEIIQLDLRDNFCLVADLSKSDDRWMFGYKVKGHGEPHIFGASGALHFGDSPEEYMDKTTVRGIIANRWDSCQYSEALNATMKVSWYFSSKTAWDMQLGDRDVPLRATAVGKQYKLGQIVPFNHTYDLFRFEDSVHPDDFEIPAGVVCPGRIKTKPFPGLPNRFAFNGEIVDYDKNVVTYVEESYDHQAKINVFRYKNQDDASKLKGNDRMLQVNDYNSGVSYIIDTSQGSCSISHQIGFGSTGYAFVEYLDHGKVRMKTPAEFFNAASVSYTYSGQRTARDIPCDVWVAKTDKIAGYTDRNLTIEWYFAVSADVEKWNTLSAEWRLPVLFRMWDLGNTNPIWEYNTYRRSPDTILSCAFVLSIKMRTRSGDIRYTYRITKPIWEYNVYYYDVVRPGFISADISPCFHGSQRRRFTFDIDGASRDDVFNNIEMFQYALKSAVSLFTGISQLRITDIEVYYDVNVMHVSFDMLDKPQGGSDVSNSTSGNDLSNAAQLYNDAMASGVLQLSVVVGTNVATIKPLAGTSAEITSASTSTGFGAGALAGLGIGMLAVGSAGGAGVAFFFFK